MKNLVFVAIFLVLVAAGVSGYGSAKEGKCPPLPSDVNCAGKLLRADHVPCFQDIECKATMKCCNDGCGGYECQQAIDLPVVPVIEPCTATNDSRVENCTGNITTYCVKDGCKQCCTSACNPSPELYVEKEECGRQLCRDNPCFGQGQKCVMDKYHRASCVCQTCPTEYTSQPVCGSDGVTYPSKCEMNVTACVIGGYIEVKYQGECAPATSPKPVTTATPVTTDVCDLPMDKGEGTVPDWSIHFYFNRKKGICRGFLYYGRGGNGNNFKDAKDCQNLCLKTIKDVCVLPKIVGPCRAAIPKWYFNKKGKCEKFEYGGCHGNGNNFKTEEECRKQCMPMSDTSICKLPKRTGWCRARIPRWYFNSGSNQCQKFTYGGCGGNENNFETDEACKQHCGPTINICELPKAPGMCYGYFPRYFFNSATKRCEKFIYGGCNGNANRFATLKECNTACGQQKVRRIQIFTGPRCLGPKKFYCRSIKKCIPVSKKCDGKDDCGDNSDEVGCDNDPCRNHICDFYATCVATLDNKPFCSCRKYCTRDYKPVCGSDGKTYSNLCTMQVKSCRSKTIITKTKDGECDDGAVANPCDGKVCDFYAECVTTSAGEAKCDCPQICVDDYRPVCGSNNKTYPNLCSLQVESCAKETMITVQNDGVCAVVKPFDICDISLCEFGTCVNVNGKATCQCLDTCPYIYAPICANNGTHNKTYENFCLMELDSCRQERHMTSEEGRCVQPNSPKLTKCQKERDLVDPNLRGLFKPSCEEDGSYSKVQCHASTGYCWCVDEQGTKRHETVVAFKRPICDAPRNITKCEAERDVNNGLLVGVFIPSCEEDGSYSKIQCHGSTGYCWCVDKEGTKVVGTDVPPGGTQPNCDKAPRNITKCEAERDVNNGLLVGVFIPSCEEDGSYSKIQCHGSTGYCWCVDKEGTKVVGTDVPPGGTQPNCDKAPLETSPPLVDICDISLCNFGKCVIVNGTATCQCPPVCPLIYLPVCANNGTHDKTYPNLCVMEAESCKLKKRFTVVNHNGSCDQSNKTKCQRERDVDIPGVVDRYTPVCLKDGSYQKLQCGFQSCWCVDEEGRQLEETETFNGAPNCNAPLETSPSLVDICDISLCDFGKCVIVNGTATCQCTDGCPRIYLPVCANNGTHNKTYSNLCVMEVESCKLKKRFTVVNHNGPCAPLETSPSLVDICDISLCDFGKCVNVNGTATCQCPPVCPLIYLPVCANNGTHDKTYPNMCVMEAEFCKLRQRFTVVNHNGSCALLETSPSLFDICDISLCDFGKCVNVNGIATCQCSDVCPRIYLPVCANNGTHNKTYPNSCVMEVESCKLKQRFTVVNHNGPCGGTFSGPRCLGPKKFYCRSIKKCIPVSKKCDGKDDCGDNSDEVDCDLSKKTKCQRERDVDIPGVLDRYTPVCLEDGSYRKLQCDFKSCWCVDEQGRQLAGTETFDGRPNCNVAQERSKCEKQLDAVPNPSRPGMFVPRCEKDGSYSNIQCHGSTGYCWCVDKEGTKVVGTDVPPGGTQPNCDKVAQERTKCEQQLDALPNPRRPGMFVPRCEKDGSYSKIQCHSSIGYCWCVDEQGTKLENTVAPFGKQLNCGPATEEKSKCEKELASVPGHPDRIPPGTFVPRCEKDGSYSKVQCHGSTGYCWCVNEQGTKLVETQVRFKTPNCNAPLQATRSPFDICDISLCDFGKCVNVNGTATCQCSVICPLIYLPVCANNGTHDKTYPNMCVMEAESCKLKQRFTVVNHNGPCDQSKKTKCQRERDVDIPGVLDRYTPVCLEDGSYQKLQCDFKSCWCVDEEGRQLAGTETFDGRPNCNATEEKSKCEKELASVPGHPDRIPPGTFVPRCEKDGSYSKVQCHGSTGYCWCVNEQGTKLVETQVRFKKPNCNASLQATRSPFDICDISLCDFGKCVNVNGTATCQCSDICPLIYAPVCANNGTHDKTYSNLCVMEAKSCKLKQRFTVVNHNGPCAFKLPDPCAVVKCGFYSECRVTDGGEAKCVCNKACTRELNWLCGSDSVTYSNLCELRKAACVQSKNITIAKPGKCDAQAGILSDPCAVVKCGFHSECRMNDGGEAKCVCNEACTRELNWLCGSDGITYSNLCELKKASCKQLKNITIAKPGKCDCSVCPVSGVDKIERSYCEPANKFVIRGEIRQIHKTAGGSNVTVWLTRRYKPRYAGKTNLKVRVAVKLEIQNPTPTCQCDTIENLKVGENYVFTGKIRGKTQLLLKIENGVTFIMKDDLSAKQNLLKAFKKYNRNRRRYCRRILKDGRL